MESNSIRLPESQIRPPKLRALVEISEYGELLIMPIAESDEHHAKILDALRFFRQEFEEISER